MISLLLASALFNATSDTTLPPIPAAPERDWTVLFYGASDNDSENTFVPDMERAMQGLPLKGVEVLAFVDRSPQYTDTHVGFGEDFADTRLYRLTDKGSERLAGGSAFPEITLDGTYEANSGDAHTLQKALRWAKATSPAQHYALVFYSHGGGDSLCPDESDDDKLFTVELTDTLTHADSLDLVVFDVCLMGRVENAYQWRPGPKKFGVDVMVATPMAGFPFPWADIFRNLAGLEGQGRSIPASDFGSLVVDSTHANRVDEYKNPQIDAGDRKIVGMEAMGCYDLKQAQSVKDLTDRLARVLSETPGARQELEDLRGSGAEVGMLHYMTGLPPANQRKAPYLDLYDVARRIPLMDCAGEDLLMAAAALEEAVDGMVIQSFGMPGYDKYDFAPGLTGLSITFPDPSVRWADLAWYGPRRIEGDKQGYGGYAWCAESSLQGPGTVNNWFQLLEHWYGKQ